MPVPVSTSELTLTRFCAMASSRVARAVSRYGLDFSSTTIAGIAKFAIWTPPWPPPLGAGLGWTLSVAVAL